MAFTVGVIEGMYDEKHSWTWEARHAYAGFCARHAFDFFIYAPKNDPYLREKWQLPWPDEHLEQLKRLSNTFREKGVKFGIGFTPFEVTELDDTTRQALKAKIALINSINPTMLSILFDDFSNNVANLAQKQSDIAEFIAGESTAKHFQMVGTFYSRDLLLERVYGKKPPHYWSELGAALDPAIDIFWTGDHVISLGYDEEGLSEIAECFQRKPFLWDNYPVNDPKWLQHRLPVYTFTGRPWQLSRWCGGHAVNPMIQPYLSMIPLATLAESYRQKDQFIVHSAFKSALKSLCGKDLAKEIHDNIIQLAHEGRSSFLPGTVKRLKSTFSQFTRPEEQRFTSEILSWLRSIDHPPHNADAPQ
ncbi:beta-N-acetylglucosaminidase domain-containing protein [Candidatus Sororendozoicomonas aggregata]|uniref:beta-N-acetylglucosaminidase domain-containing protein n=1 Tax=Candidatus Sororendozoicomonas aggregata TaxID=3073239 RepID=UPI002ECFD6E9